MGHVLFNLAFLSQLVSLLIRTANTKATLVDLCLAHKQCNITVHFDLQFIFNVFFFTALMLLMLKTLKALLRKDLHFQEVSEVKRCLFIELAE